MDTSLISVAGALLGTIVGSGLTYVAGLRAFQYREKREARIQRTGSLRIQAWLREVRLRIDRCRNEAQYHGTFGIYRDDLEADAAGLLSLLNDVPHDLTEQQALQCYTAAFRCKEAIYASDHRFESHLLMERAALAFDAVAKAQTELKESDPQAYFA
jgi:hypothetical protein